MSTQRRPAMSFDFRKTLIKVVTEDEDGNTIYIGNGSGDLAPVDIRMGKLLGCFLGKCSGSIRSIARYPDLPVIASCGLDSYLRIWDIKSRQLLSSVFLKRHLTNVIFDSHFNDEEIAGFVPPSEPKEEDELIERDDEESPPINKRKKKKSKSHEIERDDEEDSHSTKRKKSKNSQNLDGDDEGEMRSKEQKNVKKAKKNVDTYEEGSVSVEHEKPKKVKDRKSKKLKGKSIDLE